MLTATSVFAKPNPKPKEQEFPGSNVVFSFSKSDLQDHFAEAGKSNYLHATNYQAISTEPFGLTDSKSGKNLMLFCINANRYGFRQATSVNGNVLNLSQNQRASYKSLENMIETAFGGEDGEMDFTQAGLIAKAEKFVKRNASSNATGKEALSMTISALQYAIWSTIGNPVGDVRTTSDPRSQEVKKLYDYLLSKKNTSPVDVGMLKLVEKDKKVETDSQGTSTSKYVYEIKAFKSNGTEIPGAVLNKKGIDLLVSGAGKDVWEISSGGTVLTKSGQQGGKDLYKIPAGQTEITVKSVASDDKDRTIHLEPQNVPVKGAYLLGVHASDYTMGSGYNDAGIQNYIAVGQASSTPKGVQLNNKGTTEDTEITPGPGPKIHKVDTEGKGLAGVQFEVERLDGGDWNFKAGTSSSSANKPGFTTDSDHGSANISDGKLKDHDGGKGSSSGDGTYKFEGSKVESKDVPKPGEKVVVQTGGDGRATMPSVKGLYRVREVSTIAGYSIDRTPQIVRITEHSNGDVLKFVNSKLPSITIMKKSAVDGTVIADSSASFHIRSVDTQKDANGSDGKHYTQDVSTDGGSVTLENLQPGAYVITETKAPEGYILDKTPQTVNLPLAIPGQGGQSITALFHNDKKPILEILKTVDSKTGGADNKPVPGVIFEIYKDAEKIGTYTTDQDGKIVLGNGEGNGPLKWLDPGTYRIKEVFVPEPYTIDKTNDYQEVELKPNEYKKVHFTNQEKPKLRIVKYDEDNPAKLLAGAQFRIWKADNSQKPVFEGVTDANGEIITDFLEPGTYTYEEINPPPGYMLSNKTMAKRTIEVKAKDGIVTVKVDNKPLPELQIRKTDGKTGKFLKGFTFLLKEVDGSSATAEGYTATGREYTTDETGMIHIPNLKAGVYEIIEKSGPSKYIIDSTPKTVRFEGGQTKLVAFENILKPTLVIEKLDALTNKPVENTRFKVEYYKDGSRKVIGDNLRTDKQGRIVLEFVEPGEYIVTEMMPAPGMTSGTVRETRVFLNPGDNSYVNHTNGTYGGTNEENKQTGKAGVDPTNQGSGSNNVNGKMDIPVPQGRDKNGPITGNSQPPTLHQIPNFGTPIPTMKDGFVAGGANYNNVGGVTNWPKNAIVVKKADKNNGKMLTGATFELTKVSHDTSGGKGTIIATGVTDSSGIVVFAGLDPGNYIVRESHAPQNYLIDITDTQQANIKADGTSTVELTFRNTPFGHLLITKADSKTGVMLQGAEFKVTKADGTVIGNTARHITNGQGEILISNLEPGSYVITETKAPDGYTIKEEPKTIEIGTDGETYKVGFVNDKKSSLVIEKYDEVTKQPLAGAEFKVTYSDGSVVGTSNGMFVTDATGKTPVITDLKNDTITITEVKAPQGYSLSATATKTVKIENNELYKIDFYNKKLSNVQFVKIDSVTKEPLKGAEFTLYKQNGEIVGKYITDSNGVAIVDDVTLPDGWYKAVETKAPDGYVLDNTPKDFELKGNEFKKLVFENTKILGLQIKKVDASDNTPLQGAEFSVKDSNGTPIATVVTDSSGMASVNVKDGVYVITETKAPFGYVIDNTPQTVTVKAGVMAEVVFKNSKLGGAIIKKLDSVTNQPIKGAVIQIHKANGFTRFGTAGDLVGEFVTNESGIINLPAMSAGTYIATEVKAPEGYNLTEPKIFTINNDNAKQHIQGLANGPLEIVMYDDPLGTSIIHKTDAITGKPVQGAVYQIIALDGSHGQNIQGQRLIVGGLQSGLSINLGTVETNEAGIANISHLPKGWYSMQEIKAPYGYEVDPRSYNFQITGNGGPTIIRVTDEPITGQIVLTKVASNYSRATGKNTGSVLSGAIYAILDADGTQVDEITTGADGTAKSKQLMVGEYVLQEVKAPEYYMLDQTPIKVKISKQGQIVSVTAKNDPLRLGVTIKKTSDQKTANWGDTLNYYIAGIQNTSNVALDDFYVHDKFPDPSIAQVQYWDSGMWNKQYKFRFAYATNKNTAYTFLPGVYNSREHNHIDLNAGNLGLKQGEYVTQIKMVFEEPVESKFTLVEAMSAKFVVQNNVKNGTQFTNYVNVSGSYQGNLVKAKDHWTIKIYNRTRMPKTGW